MKSNFLKQDIRNKCSNNKKSNLPINISSIKNGYIYQYGGYIRYTLSTKYLDLKYKLDCAVQIKRLVDNYINAFYIEEKILTDKDKNLLKNETDKLYKTLYTDEIKLFELKNCIKVSIILYINIIFWNLVIYSTYYNPFIKGLISFCAKMLIILNQYFY